MNQLQENNTNFIEKSSILVFYVNGKKVEDRDPNPENTLLTYLRKKLHLCGTKLGCGEGGCGACTVMVSKINRETNEINHFAINACLAPICSLHGCAITTVEGIGSTKTKLHAVQERIAKSHGSQCGFCTPGFVMSMYALLRSLSEPSMKDLEIAFQGNLCRCTGYRPIIEGYKTFTREFACGMGDKCCKITKNYFGNEENLELYDKNEFAPYDPSQEPIFPPELKLHNKFDKEYLFFKGKRVTWFRPTTLHDLLTLKAFHSEGKIVSGNTEISVEIKAKNIFYPVLINVAQIKELNEIKEHEKDIQLGAALNLSSIEEALVDQIEKLPEEKTRSYKSIVKMLHYFGGKQVRNVASVGGNIMTSSPISDLNPIWISTGSIVQVGSLVNGKLSITNINITDEFFTGYRQNAIKPQEVIISIKIPKTTNNQYILSYKQSKRRDDDIAIVNASFNIVFKKNTDIIEQIVLAFGGMGPTTLSASNTSKCLKGLKWNQKLLETAIESLIKELELPPSAPGGMTFYRKTLTLSLFFKAYVKICSKLEGHFKDFPKIPMSDKSSIKNFEFQIPRSVQLFEKPIKPEFKLDPIGKPICHLSALKHATGEAVYCDDIPKFENELYLAFVLSTRSYAKILSIDETDALKMNGVYSFLSYKDLSPQRNLVGIHEKDEEVFASHTVFCQGQTIAAVIAETQQLAQEAAKMVKVTYQDLLPLIISIEDAVLHKSYFPGFPKTLTRGNIDVIMANKNYFLVEGTCRLGGQEHFYLEPHVALAIPRDNEELEIFSATQQPSQIQQTIAEVLGISISKINCKVKRIGGGFGGKEPRSMLVAIPVAVAAYKINRPIRCVLDRDQDMQMTGTRHPFLFKYKVACTKEGQIKGIELEMYSNGGCTSDHSYAVLEHALLSFQNSYFIPNCKITFAVCKTNLPSNTAFRGFGSPQVMLSCENMIRDVSKACGLDYVEVATLNMYKDGDITHYNQVMENCTVRRCWDECIEKSKFYDARESCKQFNANNKWKKRAVAICPTTYGISIPVLHLNQGAALVNIYQDGSVLVNHGGVEMGQGIHIKMIQIASRALLISKEKVHINETTTDKVPNTTGTVASLGSDLNGMAVLNACKTLIARLNPIKIKFPNESWEFWINQAYLERISLSATGFYKTPDIFYDPVTKTGKPYLYYTNGAAASVVEIDCLTGDHQVLRTDIVMDVGSSLNPAIDVGQIEGGFMQGYGLYTIEEMIYSPDGALLSKGPSSYKIPTSSNIPIEFNVSLLTGSENPKTIYSSKAIGEPPLFLASSVFFAIKDAISAARTERNLNTSFDLISPATSERIRMGCEDQFTKMIFEPKEIDFTPWNVIP